MAMIFIDSNSSIQKMKITGERTCTFKDVYFLNIKDLDPNPENKLAVEKYPKEPKFYPCPHQIVKNIAE